MNTPLSSYALSQPELDEMHRVAHGAYLQGRYDEAVRYFWFISLHAPSDLRYLKGLAAGLFMARAFSEASVVYAYLLQVAPADAEVHCLLGQTLLMMSQREQAKEYLERVAHLPGGDADVIARARALLEIIAS